MLQLEFHGTWLLGAFRLGATQGCEHLSHLPVRDDLVVGTGAEAIVERIGNVVASVGGNPSFFSKLEHVHAA